MLDNKVMILKKTLLSFLILLSVSAVFAQDGFIRGTVFDDISGESLPGVTIILEGTTDGTLSDFDGKFNLAAPPGNYTVRFSFISYETIYILVSPLVYRFPRNAGVNCLV